MKDHLQKNTDFDAKEFVKHLTGRPGVYQMLDCNNKVIYVGKAKNLKKRVSSYFQRSESAPKVQALVKHINCIEVTVTHTENEALILENNLIKSLLPRYNILLRDDKSYPYIYLSSHQKFPKLTSHRGARSKKGHYFGPYPSAGAVRESLNLLQKIFQIRQCEDSFFANRSRPCLQYQIKRCSAPCTELISEENYRQNIDHAVLFLEGKNQQVIDALVLKMDMASSFLDFEKAAIYRDQIIALRKIQEKQYVSGDGGDMDVVAVDVSAGIACVQVFYIRGGRSLGGKSFFPRNIKGSDASSVLTAFLPQYYLGKDVPQEIIVSERLDDAVLLEQVLTESSGHKVVLSHNVRLERARWLAMAVTNARYAVKQRLADKAGMQQRIETLQQVLGMDNVPQRMECFDISHTQGELAVASCVVFDRDGPLKSDYRRFNIEGITPGDDYAAMNQALTRRYMRLKKGEGKIPDILFIDGGKGQVSEAEKVLEELQITDIVLVGVAKGPERIAGNESLFLSSRSKPIILPSDSRASHLIQQIRDEAHRFAITGHRKRRAKARTTSPLEAIRGLGAKRRQILLKQFGGLQEVARAGVEELANVHGISKQLAERIYDQFHEA